MFPISEERIPVRALSLRSSCRSVLRVYILLGIEPPIRLKLRSRTSSAVSAPISEGITPDITPFSRLRTFRAERCCNSEGKVPANPFCSVKDSMK